MLLDYFLCYLAFYFCVKRVKNDLMIILLILTSIVICICWDDFCCCYCANFCCITWLFIFLLFDFLLYSIKCFILKNNLKGVKNDLVIIY